MQFFMQVSAIFRGRSGYSAQSWQSRQQLVGVRLRRGRHQLMQSSRPRAASRAVCSRRRARYWPSRQSPLQARPRAYSTERALQRMLQGGRSTCKGCRRPRGRKPPDNATQTTQPERAPLGRQPSLGGRFSPRRKPDNNGTQRAQSCASLSQMRQLVGDVCPFAVGARLLRSLRLTLWPTGMRAKSKSLRSLRVMMTIWPTDACRRLSPLSRTRPRQ